MARDSGKLQHPPGETTWPEERQREVNLTLSHYDKALCNDCRFDEHSEPRLCLQ